MVTLLKVTKNLKMEKLKYGLKMEKVTLQIY